MPRESPDWSVSPESVPALLHPSTSWPSPDVSAFLERLEGQVSPEDLFTTIPGIGEELAHRIHDVLHVETLEELELAASDGRLEQVPGFGPRRARSVRDILATVLARSTRRRARQFQPTSGVRPTRPIGEPDETSTRPDPNLPATRPSVAVLLDVDRDYRRRAAAGQLRRISPRRFNPEGKAWLPIYHTERDGWWFTALYSNTRRAHERGRTHDWVILYFQRNGHEDQCTVVTEYQGELAGRRVVRGRELECLDYYYPTRPSPQAAPPASSPH